MLAKAVKSVIQEATGAAPPEGDAAAQQAQVEAGEITVPTMAPQAPDGDEDKEANPDEVTSS